MDKMLKFNFFLIVSSVLSVLLFNNCCHKVACIEISAIHQVHFEGFSPDELDTVYLETYANTDKLLISLDTFITLNRLQRFDKNGFSLSLTNPLVSEFNYHLKLNSNNGLKTYRISEFAFKEDVCNECLLIPDQKFTTLIMYTINGERKEFNFKPFIKIVP